MSRWRSSRTWTIGTAATVFIVCCILPFAVPLIDLVQQSPDAYRAMLLDARQRGLLYNTTALGAGSAIVAAAFGVPLGILLARVGLRRKTLLRIALAVPALIPPYVVALAWVYLGRAGGILSAVFGRDVLSGWTYSLPAAILVLAVVFYPLSMLATEISLRRIDGHLEEAALLVASRSRVLRQITLPLAAPGVLAASLLIFVLAVSEFGAPGLLRVRVYTSEVFTAFAALYDVPRAMALTIPLLILCVTVAVGAATLASDRLVTTPRGSSSQLVLFEHWRRAGRTFALAVIALAVGVPVLILLREAAGIRSLSSVMRGSGGAVANSLILAATGATLVVSVALWLGYACSRARGGAGRWADALFVVLFAIPSTVVGVGLIELWNRQGPLGTVYGTNAMFLLAYLARFVPVAVLMLSAVSRYVPIAHEEAAAVSGAGWIRTITHIVLPQMRFGVAITWLIVFVLAFGELGVSILVAPPGDATLPIRIYTMVANAPSSSVAAFALLQMIVIFASVLAFGTIASLRKLL
jgi:iron(III) transport system permease protein